MILGELNQLYGKQALQVVFSRPIIALGSDFGDVDAYAQAPFTLSCNKEEEAGFRFRWVTTSIARIDPVNMWPKCDLRCTFSFKQNFASYDGVLLNLNGIPADQKLENYCPPKQPLIYKASPKGHLQKVITEWPMYPPTYPSIGNEMEWYPPPRQKIRSNAYEVPPDARLHLDFNFEITKDILERNLQLIPGVPGLQINVTSYHTEYNVTEWRRMGYQEALIVPWKTPVVSCQAEIVFSRPLEPNTEYFLQLSLEQSDVIKERIHGLSPFHFHFLDGLAHRIKLRSKYFMLYLPHGLSPQNTSQQLSQQLRICKSADAILGLCESESLRAFAVDVPAERKHRSIALMHVPELEPSQNYSILVQANASIQDAFGQPLQGSNGSFVTQDPPALFLRPSSRQITTIKPRSKPLKWPFLVKGNPGFCKASVHQLAVNDQESSSRLVHAMQLWHHSYYFSHGYRVCDKHGDKWEAMLRNLSDPISQIETSTTEENKAAQLDLMLRPGYPVQLASVGCVEQMWDGKRCWDWHLQLLLQANISASAWVSSSQDDLLAWVTHAGTDQQQQRGPVLGAHVFFFKIDNGKDTQGIIGSCHTNEQGVCHVAAQALAYMAVKLVAVVLGPAGDALYLRMGSLSERDVYPTYLGKLVLDRAIVPLGDTLHVTGYVQEQSAAGRLHAPRQNMSALMDVYIDGQKWGASVVTSLSEHGSLHASIPVPKLSKPGRYICCLRLNDDDEFSFLTSESFVVSDPRPPTATLLLDAPAWSKPNVSVPIGLQAISYLGNQVSGVDITVKWSCPGIPNREKAVRTNDKGKAQLAIPLQSPENDCHATNGGILTVNAEWVGPTREPIFQTTRTELDHSSVRVALNRSIDTVLPGVQFSPIVEVISNVNGTSLKGVPVAVLIAPVGRENMCDVDTKCMQPQTCSVISGELLPECRLTLPCMGTYCFKACTHDEFGTKTCDNLQFGWDTNEWKNNSISGFVQPTLHQSEHRFKQGSTASLSFDSPYIGEALVVWGNSASQLRTLLLDVASPGRQLFHFPIGKECSGNCAVSVALSVPGISENSRATCPAGVPVSKTFDCDRPQTLHMATSIIVEEDRSLDVKLSSSTVEEDAPALSGVDEHVFEPGQPIKLSASSFLGGEEEMRDTEITLIAVDKAMLDMVSYKLPNVQKAFHVDLSWPSHRLMSLDPNRINLDIKEAIFAILLKHLQLSPWTGLPPSTWYEDFGRDFTSVSIDNISEEDCSHLAESIDTLTPRQFPRCSLGVVAEKNSQGSCVFWPELSCFPPPPPPPPSKAPSSPIPPMARGPFDAPRDASEFVATPLFYTLRPGTNTVEFNAPPKLGTYVIRAFAVSKVDGQSGKQMYGQTEGELIVRRKLSLTPSLPRQVRVGDMFLGGVLATAVFEGGNVDVSASITCNVAPLSTGKAQPIVLLNQEARTQVSLTKDAPQQEVRFAFNASALGTSKVHCSGGIEGKVMDSLLVPVPVLEQQLPVNVATSFAVRPSGPGMEEQHGEGLVLPDALPEYGSIDVFAGLGHLPSASASYEAVAAKMARESFPQGSASLFLATQPFIWTQYKQQLSDKQASIASQAVSDLANLTNEHFGLLECLPGSRKWCNRRVRSVTLNAWAVWAFSEASHQEEVELPEKFKMMKSSIRTDMLPRWREAIAQQLMAESEAQRYNPHKAIHNETWVYSNLRNVAWARLALGARWDAPLCEPPSANSHSWQRFLAQGANHTAWDWQDQMALKRQRENLKQRIWNDRDISEEVQTCTTPRVREDLSLHRLMAQAPARDMLTYILTALALQEMEEPFMAHTDFVKSAAGSVIDHMRVTGRTAYIAERVDSPSAKGYNVQALALQLLIRIPWRAENILVQKLAAYVAQEDKHQSGGLIVSPSSQALTVMVNALAAYDVARGSATPDLKLEVSVAQAKDILWAHFDVSSPNLVKAEVPWEDMPTPPGQLAVKASGSGEVSMAISLDFIPASVLRVPQYRGLWVENAVRALNETSGKPVGPLLSQATLGSVLSITVQVCTADDLEQVSLIALMPGGLEPIDPVLLSKDRDAWIPMEVRAAAVHFFWPFMSAGTHHVSFLAVAVTEGNFVLPPFKAFAENQPEVLGLTPGGLFQVTPKAHELAILGGNKIVAA